MQAFGRRLILSFRFYFYLTSFLVLIFILRLILSRRFHSGIESVIFNTKSEDDRGVFAFFESFNRNRGFLKQEQLCHLSLRYDNCFNHNL